MAWWLVLLPVAALWTLSLWIWVRGRRYRAVFQKDHVREVLLGLAPLGRAGLERANQDFTEGDPRMLVTSQGLVLSYAVERRNELFVHRLMLRHLGGVTTYPVARRFLALALLVFDEDDECDRVQATPERLFFAEWRVGQERQGALNRAGFAIPPGQTDDQIRALLEAADRRASGLAQSQAEPALPATNPTEPVDPPQSRT